MAVGAPTVLTLKGAHDFVGIGGAPLPTGFSSFASVKTDAPFGTAIRSGASGGTTSAYVGVLFSPGVTVDSVSSLMMMMIRLMMIQLSGPPPPPPPLTVCCVVLRLPL